MNHSSTNINPHRVLDLHFGPLRYRIQAYDQSGVEVLKNISEHIVPPAQSNTPDRVIHLVNELPQSTAKELPTNLQRHLSDKTDKSTWIRYQNSINDIMMCPDANDTFWIAPSASKFKPLRFHLPWGIIIDDIVQRGGGLIHGGLARKDNSGLLFIAPPSGGKTTTLHTAPSCWQILSDDAVLVWPGKAGAWHSSPLPAWGNMLRPKEPWLYPDMALDNCCQLKGAVLLEKSATVQLEKLKPSALTPEIYRALREYPATIAAREIHLETFFRTSALISRQLQSWRLSLPLHGDVWPLLTKEAA
jgi:hypothetical protein